MDEHRYGLKSSTYALGTNRRWQTIHVHKEIPYHFAYCNVSYEEELTVLD